MLRSFLLAAKLFAADTTATSQELCIEAGHADGSDSYEMCFCSLETYRCEAQGWCDADESAPYEAAAQILPSTEIVRAGCEH
jgi:hypothetical protein